MQSPGAMSAPPYHGSSRMDGSGRGRGSIFGQIQLSLYYTELEHQLVVTVHQAVDLPPRADGTPRIPYVKMFLLPDRSEKSRRQSKVLAGTCQPIWQQPFIYQVGSSKI